MSKLPKGVISVCGNIYKDAVVNAKHDLIIGDYDNWWNDGISAVFCGKHWKAITGIKLEDSKPIRVKITAEIVE